MGVPWGIWGQFGFMKVVVIIMVALLLLGGGGAGAYFYFKQPAQAASGAAGEHAEGLKQKHKSENHTANIFVQLDPLILPIIGPDGVTQTVSMVVVIETSDEAGKTYITQMGPRLKDAFIQDMYGVLSQELLIRGGVIQVSALKNRLQKISARVLGEGIAEEVLLQVVQQRPL